ncbi:MAG: hypothetical protein V7K21_25795 [Nostoc sp.]|uniref:hypothetical protein n=1 Tax=Nostoc sp. TaxID=1180 RepID=UPI002FF5B691
MDWIPLVETETYTLYSAGHVSIELPYIKLLKKILALCFLLFGIPFSAGMIWETMNPKTAP